MLALVLTRHPIRVRTDFEKERREKGDSSVYVYGYGYDDKGKDDYNVDS